MQLLTHTKTIYDAEFTCITVNPSTAITVRVAAPDITTDSIFVATPVTSSEYLIVALATAVIGNV